MGGESKEHQKKPEEEVPQEPKPDPEPPKCPPIKYDEQQIRRHICRFRYGTITYTTTVNDIRQTNNEWRWGRGVTVHLAVTCAGVAPANERTVTNYADCIAEGHPIPPIARVYNDVEYHDHTEVNTQGAQRYNYVDAQHVQNAQWLDFKDGLQNGFALNPAPPANVKEAGRVAARQWFWDQGWRRGD